MYLTTASRSCEAEIQWLDLDAGSTGTFFVNKTSVDLQGAGNADVPWEPAHLKNTSTKILSFEDVVPKEGLERALVVNSCKLSDILHDCFYFLPKTDLTVVCFPETGDCSNILERTIKVCPLHKDTEFTFHEGMVSGTLCGCTECSRLTILHSPEARKLRTKLFLLRYKDFLRVVIPSGNIGSLFWRKIGLFGWFIDLPYKREAPAPVSGEQAPQAEFELELRVVLKCLKVENADKWLEDVDFSRVSPAVHLVCALPQRAPSGMSKYLSQLIRPVRTYCQGWKKHKYIQSHAVNIRYQDITALMQFNLDMEESIKLIYPSSQCVLNAVRNMPNLTLKDIDQSTNLKYLENFLNLKNLLHKADDNRVLPYANVYLELFSKQGPVECQKVLGWFLFGSQTFGNHSFGVNGKMERHELGVAVVPYVKDDILHAIDLSQVGFHFSLDPPKYARPDFPIISGHRVYRCQGQILKFPGSRTLVPMKPMKVGDLAEAEKYELNCLPMNEENRSVRTANLYKDAWDTSFKDTKQARPGVYIDFLCNFIYSNKFKQHNLRVSYVISAHEMLSGLLRSLGKEEAANGVAEMEHFQLAGSIMDERKEKREKREKQQQPKVLAPKLSEHRQKFKDLYGEGTEEEFEKYWTEQFQDTYAFPTLIPDGDYENYKGQNEFDVNPWTSKLTDHSWIERQVCKTYQPLPSLVGQFNVPYMKGHFKMLGHKMFPGLEDIEKAAGNEVI